MNIEKLSSKYQVRHLKKCDAQTVLDLYESNPLYFEHCPPPPTIQSVEYDMRALPDGKRIAYKHFVGFFNGNNLVAVLDLIEKYPDKQTVFIGLFMVAAAYQGRGVGSKIVSFVSSNLLPRAIRTLDSAMLKQIRKQNHFGKN